MKDNAPTGWYRFLYSSFVLLYYRRLHVLGREHLPAGGAVLYAMLHRNGAIDGMVYHCAFRQAVFLISTQLTRSLFGRLVFTGIPIARAADSDDRGGNPVAVQRCVDHLVAGGELGILPEGTSDLGPRHLPFKPGIAVILGRARAAGAQVTVLPVGVFYQAPDRFRSDVTVVVGPPVEAQPATDPMESITRALEDLGVNVETAEELARIERLATVAAEGDPGLYYRTLKRLERNPLPAAPVAVAAPAGVTADWQGIEDAIRQGEVATAYGAPVFSKRGALWSFAWLTIQAPLTGAAALLNLPPLAAGWWAGRRLADARNTIALWRALIGLPAFGLWIVAVAGIALALGRPALLAGYVLLTAAGLVLYPELIERWARLRNRFRAQAFRPAWERVRAWLENG